MSKAVFKLVVSLMEAYVDCGTHSNAIAHACDMEYLADEDLYIGHFCKKTAEKLQEKGVLTLKLCEAGWPAIRLNERDSFLVSFAAGALEASRGNGIYYADYSSNPLAFSIGHKHFSDRQKANTRPYIMELDHYCHGFLCADTNEVYKQS